MLASLLICCYPGQPAEAPKLKLRHYPFRFGQRLAHLRGKFAATAQGKPHVSEGTHDLLEVMREVQTQFLDVADVWHDAKMEEVLLYLRGSKNLSIPPEYKEYIPVSVPCPPSIA